MITEDYVSFEIAKLLNIKGFKGEFHKHYWGYEPGKEFLTNDSFNPEYDYPAPTLQIVIKWLREVHKLYITVVPFPLNFEHQDIQDGWGCEVTHLSNLSYDGDYEFFQKRYPIYEQACEAAIRCCLENLI